MQYLIKHNEFYFCKDKGKDWTKIESEAFYFDTREQAKIALSNYLLFSKDSDKDENNYEIIAIFTIKEVFDLKGITEFDIGDEIFDWVSNFCYCDPQEDYFDKCMYFMADKINVLTYRYGWYSCVDVSRFISENQEAFDKFMNEHNREGFRPCNHDKITIDDEEFYDLYMLTFRNLIEGNYCDSDYKCLLELLGGQL